MAAQSGNEQEAPNFYFRYYNGHHGRHGHEFVELEVKADGTLRYANNSRYRGDKPLKKEARITPPVMSELMRIVHQSSIMNCDDANWPVPDRGGRQELEVLYEGQHISFATNKTSTVNEIENLAEGDKEGLGVFLRFVQDARLMLLTLISLHHRMHAI